MCQSRACLAWRQVSRARALASLLLHCPNTHLARVCADVSYAGGARTSTATLGMGRPAAVSV